MTKRTAFWIFLLGTLSSAVLFLYLTYDTQKQVKTLTHVDKLSDEVVAGKRVWEKYNCNDCHTILGFGAYYAPDMTKVYQRIGADGITRVVKNPDVVFKDTWRKMPKQNVDDAEIKNLVAFFKWVGEIDNNDWPPQDSSTRLSRPALKLAGGVGMSLGAALFKEKGCMGCHTISGAGGTIGPSLDEVAHKYNLDEFQRLIKNPKSVNANATMPPQGELTEAELNAVAGFLTTLK